MRVLSLVARNGVEKYPRAIEELEEIFATQLPRVHRATVVIDNARPAGSIEPLGDCTTVIGGDTALREFSGWDRGIEHVGASLGDYDLVHFATAAFNTLYVRYLQRFTPGVLDTAAARRACVGHIDFYNETVELGSFRSRHWIRSAFFMLPPSEVRILGRMLALTDGRPLFSGDPVTPFRADAPLCATYQRYITGWLRGDDIGQGTRWHSGFAVDHESLREFEQKTLAILNEQLLSIRLRAQGCPLVDVTWLDSVLKRTGRPPDLFTPWAQQMADRDESAALVR
jgi:hypothetical protein